MTTSNSKRRTLTTVIGTLLYLCVIAFLVLWGLGEGWKLGTALKPSAAVIPQPAASALAPSPSGLTDSQKVGLLRAEAKRWHLHWKVFCTPSLAKISPEELFEGWAWPEGTAENAYYEDGGRDNWSSTAPTQAEAAYRLYRAIQHEPNQPVAYRETIKSKDGKLVKCPRTLTDRTPVNEPCCSSGPGAR